MSPTTARDHRRCEITVSRTSREISHFSARGISVQWISDRRLDTRGDFSPHVGRSHGREKMSRQSTRKSPRSVLTPAKLLPLRLGETYTTHCNRGGCSYSTFKRVIKLSTYLESVHVPPLSPATGKLAEKGEKEPREKKAEGGRTRDPEHKRSQTIQQRREKHLPIPITGRIDRETHSRPHASRRFQHAKLRPLHDYYRDETRAVEIKKVRFLSNARARTTRVTSPAISNNSA